MCFQASSLSLWLISLIYRDLAKETVLSNRRIHFDGAYTPLPPKLVPPGRWGDRASLGTRMRGGGERVRTCGRGAVRLPCRGGPILESLPQARFQTRRSKCHTEASHVNVSVSFAPRCRLSCGRVVSKAAAYVPQLKNTAKDADHRLSLQ